MRTRGEFIFAFIAVILGIWIAIGNPLPNFHRVPTSTSTPSVPVSAPAASLPPISVLPRDVRAIYLTAGRASVPRYLDSAIQLIEDSELNAVVINVKDGDGIYLGPGMEEIAKKLREHGVYPIARVVVFQDGAFAVERPDLAVHASNGSVWSDPGGYRWVDPASREVWDRVVNASIRAIDLGFAEVNFDYVRFPSDGDLDSLSYPVYTTSTPKENVIADFLKYASERIHRERPNAIVSADVFAFSFLSRGDLGIGQHLETIAAYPDVVSPMVYPSHFSPDTFGFSNPAEHPYEIVEKTLSLGIARLRAVSSTIIVRPWIQDFNMGAVYDTPMFREQIRAIHDAGVGDSWMVWNPSNIYDSEKFIRGPASRR